MDKRIAVFILLLGILTFFPSCNTYEEGPEISLRSDKDRVTNSWKVIYCITESGDDCTGGYATYVDHILRNGEWIIEFSPQSVLGGGTWTFEEDNSVLRYENEDGNSSIVFEYTILRSAKKELWVETENGTELHFVPNDN